MYAKLISEEQNNLGSILGACYYDGPFPYPTGKCKNGTSPYLYCDTGTIPWF